MELTSLGSTILIIKVSAIRSAAGYALVASAGVAGPEMSL
jgi:hypothetical protein